MTTHSAQQISYGGFRGCQNGVSTLFVTLALLLLTSLVLLYTTRGAITEQRLSANEIRMKQAFAAANAGLEHGGGYFGNGGVDHNKDGVTDSVVANALFDSGGKASYYQVAFCNPAPPECPASHATALACSNPLTAANFTRPLVVACGWSDDDSSVVRMTQFSQGTPALPGSITAPVVSRGATSLLNGGASILNYFNDLTVWSGGAASSHSSPGKTFVRDIATNPFAEESFDYRNTGNSPACNNPPSGYLCSTTGSTVGHDIVQNDSSLANLTSAQFFRQMMGKDMAVYRDTVASWVVDLNGTLTGEDSNSIGSITGMGDAVIWVEGNASLSGTIGTLDHPVVLVVNGDLDLGSNVEVNGLVYVSGEMTGNGNPTIYGALISAGAVGATGNLKVIYDPKTLGGVGGAGKAGQLAGSWKDW